MMRFLLSIGVTAAMLCGPVASARAQTSGNAPWCAMIDYGAGFIVNECYYQTFEQCAANIIGGQRGFCNVNPAWTPPPGPRAQRKRHVRQY